jgi:hypothetical protein
MILAACWRTDCGLSMGCKRTVMRSCSALQRIAARSRQRGAATCALLAAGLLAPHAAPAQTRDPMLLYDNDGWAVRAHLQVGLNAVVERDLFWSFADTFARTKRFNDDTQWLEAYLKPGLSFTKALERDLIAYGKVSMIASGTLGQDAFAAGNTGRVSLEEGYLGLRKGEPGGLTFDLSVGPREYKAGTGMLIANGGSSGFERGALKLGPYKAWEFATLARVGLGNFSGTAFYLDAHELPSTDNGTKIAGADLRYDGASGMLAGLTYGNVVASSAPYPKAPPGGIGPPSILPGARNGLNFVNLYGRANPFPDVLRDFFIAGDFAYEWNDRIDLSAWAARVQVGYTFTDVRWTPTITYSYQTFSGDDPSTTKLERFDPLYFEGNPNAWSTGSKSSMVFINSNANAHQISFSVKPTPQDTITLRYAYISANQLLSPIQFGQATRVDFSNRAPNVIAGVTDYHLSDDIFLEYNRAINANTYLTAGVSVSIPGRGVDLVVPTKAPYWPGGFVNVVFNF